LCLLHPAVHHWRIRMTEADVKEIKMLLRQLLARLDQIAARI
jgi:hypothetical protein